MIDFENQTTYEISVDYLDKMKEYLTKKDVELLLVGNEFMQGLNYSTRGVDKPTDVLSFPLEELPHLQSVGSVVINLDFVQNKAKELNHSIDDEISLLFMHGLLHLLGFDHEVDGGCMREKEKEIIKKFNLPKSLIVRNEDEL